MADLSMSFDPNKISAASDVASDAASKAGVAQSNASDALSSASDAVSKVATKLASSFLGLGSLADPGADRILFWDDSEGAFKWLSLASGLSITATVLSGGNMIYTTAATHAHSGGGAYETTLNIAATHSGQALVILQNPKAVGYHAVQITVDGTVVLADLTYTTSVYSGVITYIGVFNFNSSLKVEHKSDLATNAICKVAYCSV